MEFRYLGRSGLKVSALSFGSWVSFANQLDDSEAAACMREAFDAGCNFFDNAEVYADGKSEEMMGRVLKKAGWQRSEVVVSTKIFWGGQGVNQRGLSRKHIVEGVDAALSRLQLDYVDLVFCHRPDLHTPVEETVRAMTHVINQGKALYWGTSEWSADRIMEAHAIARREHLIGPTMEQPEYNMFKRDRVEREYAHLYETIGLGTTTWSPLASGLLTGKYNDGHAPAGSRATVSGYEWLQKRLLGSFAKDRIGMVHKLAEVASSLCCTLAQLAIAWCLLPPYVSTVITGASSAAQVKENMQVMSVLPKLTGEVRAHIDEILANRPESETDFR